MTEEGYHKVAINGVLVILTGMLIAGFPLVWIVTHVAYGQAMPIDPGGDYRGWMMAHLEGILNGMLMIALATVVRGRPVTPRGEKWLVWSLLLLGWGNAIASVLAPILGVRGMAFDGSASNNLVLGIFNIAFIATATAFFLVLRSLTRRPAIS